MEILLNVYGFNLLVIIVMMTALWLVSLYLRNASIADIFWGAGFVLVGWLTFFRVDGYLGRKLLICLLFTIWGLRLSIYIAWRNYGHGEDRRYRAWRAEHGKNFWWVSFFTVFGIQGVLLWLISLTIQAGQTAPLPDRITWLDSLGLLVWLVGFFFEAVGDWQLSRFRSDPQNRGRVMQSGLWAYTRHPNYFGETLIWWGLFLITLSTPGGLWTIISPITITFLLLKVSGVTLLEKTILDSRPAYREYIERTNAFIPWLPKRKK